MSHPPILVSFFFLLFFFFCNLRKHPLIIMDLLLMIVDSGSTYLDWVGSLFVTLV